MSSTLADVMVATLRASGVQRVYGIPGDSLNGLTDAIRRDGEIAWEHVRHEEAAAFAASGEAAVTGRLAVCAASCGPGNLHLINGLFEANRSRVPVLAIAAHIPAEEIGSSYFQETHPQELFRECSVYTRARQRPRAAPTHPGDRDARGARARGRWGRDRPAGALPDPGTRPCGRPGGSGRPHPWCGPATRPSRKPPKFSTTRAG